jgi:hypothetical protein
MYQPTERKMTMKTLSFNTGRTYTPKGQRLACALLDSGDIVFVDVDRNVYGTIQANGLTRDEMLTFGQFTQNAIMSDYDQSKYANDLSANETIVQQLTAIAQTI